MGEYIMRPTRVVLDIFSKLMAMMKKCTMPGNKMTKPFFNKFAGIQNV